MEAVFQTLARSLVNCKLLKNSLNSTASMINWFLRLMNPHKFVKFHYNVYDTVHYILISHLLPVGNNNASTSSPSNIISPRFYHQSPKRSQASPHHRKTSNTRSPKTSSTSPPFIVTHSPYQYPSPPPSLMDEDNLQRLDPSLSMQPQQPRGQHYPQHKEFM